MDQCRWLRSLDGRVFDRMYDAFEGSDIEQEPGLRAIRAAAHESECDFVLRRK